ncbi:nibrin [Trichonephila clavipes]|uniref:Nibrin n=1 Tax=Trichonephila clavipes TaxID=2585209 RepID=A0A8X6VG11_TRICX|nr:nibrin [Trichonephila clavipes]
MARILRHKDESVREAYVRNGGKELIFCLWMTTPDLTMQTCRRMPSIGGYHPYGLGSILTGLESNRECVGYAWPTNYRPSTPSHLSTGISEAIA